MVKKIPGGVTAVPGILASGMACGIKKRGKDLALIVSEPVATAAGVFTTNRLPAAPVILSKDQLKSGRAAAILVNSGNSNSFTGSGGLQDARKSVEMVASQLKIDPGAVLVASTGVIGQRLPMEKIRNGIPQLVERLSRHGGSDAADAILTTDTRRKVIAVEVEIDGKAVRIGGMAKGVAMLHPKMATMIAVLTTDATIDQGSLQGALSRSIEHSFNRVTVDGDTSTNDTVFCLANGVAGNQRLSVNHPDFAKFQGALDTVALFLAKELVRDGEGATKFIEITVRGAKESSHAKAVAMSIANSNLVKTAFFGEDPNWGRVIDAIGNAGVELSPESLSLSFGPYTLVENGNIAPGNWRSQVRRYLRRKHLNVTLELGLGKEEVTVWTSDLSYEYVRLNAEYTT
ncbi:MAG: bifunctional glutamate N-acetyltransferase/amino-acid acetyltransferase ArgJ [Candidatus Tectomicrobia bacterium]|nr:bifunctional glutamate N-acetyltransferase/amino-acid acetyltransferase ArgJ [Candidatus Tectomicrobia bacterium]